MSQNAEHELYSNKKHQHGPPPSEPMPSQPPSASAHFPSAPLPPLSASLQRATSMQMPPLADAEPTLLRRRRRPWRTSLLVVSSIVVIVILGIALAPHLFVSQNRQQIGLFPYVTPTYTSTVTQATALATPTIVASPTPGSDFVDPSPGCAATVWDETGYIVECNGGVSKLINNGSHDYGISFTPNAQIAFSQQSPRRFSVSVEADGWGNAGTSALLTATWIPTSTEQKTAYNNEFAQLQIDQQGQWTSYETLTPNQSTQTIYNGNESTMSGAVPQKQKYLLTIAFDATNVTYSINNTIIYQHKVALTSGAFIQIDLGVFPLENQRSASFSHFHLLLTL